MAPPWRREPPKRMLERFARDLDLTSDQKDQVAKVFESNRDKIEQAFAQVRPQLREIREDTHQRIRKLLTPAQQNKLDAQEAEMDKHGPPEGPPFPPPPMSE
jgi:Spy/CpxP family protein refolding chaperone